MQNLCRDSLAKIGGDQLINVDGQRDLRFTLFGKSRSITALLGDPLVVDIA
ncbi:hypothetical protein BDD14_6595 [Edaphobacter modestus]|uniref:Uncharacterized protein n=1 Tax=Edaphobacter modestus TaxID=388466 RepID=A0A4Q7XXC3_9BACT|nr:hypothetical protein BDD14_6595 [Edaphobacter modestus]